MTTESWSQNGGIASPCPYLARVRNGDEVVAESADTMRVDHADGAPALWFPSTEVRTDQVPEAAVADHTKNGWVRFDHEHPQVRIDLVDGVDGEDPRDVTLKRFPNWGDAADLIALLDVQPAGDGTYVSGARADWRRPVAEGSQLLGQTVVAAMRHADGRRVVSAHMAFLRVADSGRPVRIELDQRSAGRTFTAVAAQVLQDDWCCAAGTLLLDATAPDVIRHAEAPPPAAAAGPYAAAPVDMGVTGRDLRVVDDAYTGAPDAPVGPPELDAWVRFRSVPDDPALHAGLLAQFTGHLSIAAALRPHAGIGQHAAHDTLSMGINAIAIAFHAPVRVDQWLLYHHRSTFAGDGMTHAECRVHDEAGALVASFTVDAMVRAFAGASTAESDARTAL